MPWFGACCECDEDEPTAISVQEVVDIGRTSLKKPQAVVGVPEHAEQGDLIGLQKLLHSGGDPNEVAFDSDRSCTSATGLILASKAGHLDVVKLLLKQRGLNVNAISEDLDYSGRSGQTALHWAARGMHVDVVKALLADSRTRLDPTTDFGKTPLMVSCELGPVEVVELLLDARANADHAVEITQSKQKLRLSNLFIAISAGHADVVAALVQKGGVSIATTFPTTLVQKSSPLLLAVGNKATDIVTTLLRLRADPNVADGNGMSAIMRAVEDNSVEIVMHLMAAGADTSKVFSPAQRLQVQGDAFGLQGLVNEKAVRAMDNLPALHMAVLGEDMHMVQSEIQSLQGSIVQAQALLDGGNLPATYYAVELCLPSIAKVLLRDSHGLSDEVAEAVVRHALQVNDCQSRSPKPQVGERMFQVAQAMLLLDTPLWGDWRMGEGARAFLAPWCGSLSALNFFSTQKDKFTEFRKLCERRCQDIYVSIDKVVGSALLERLAGITAAEPSGPRRQDEPGLLPRFEYLFSERQPMGGNHEVFTAKALSILAMSIDRLFEIDVSSMFSGMAQVVAHTPSKSFQRMMNKLMNPLEHGDPTIPKPRPMKNLDVLRCGLAFTTCDKMEQAFKVLKENFRILRVKNNHKHGSTGGFGGYRQILVNFAYAPGITFAELFGYSGTSDAIVRKSTSTLDSDDETAQKWYKYMRTLGPSHEAQWWLAALWRVARLDPDAKVVIAAEAQFIFYPYYRGRHFSHFLYKVARSETGCSEMVRDFATSSFRAPLPEEKHALDIVQRIAGEIRQQRQQQEEQQ